MGWRSNGLARQMPLKLGTKLVDQTNGLQVLPQGKAPSAEQTLRIKQINVTHTGMVMVANFQPRAVGPFLPCSTITLARQQALVGNRYHTFDKMELRIKVNLKHGQHVLLRLEW
jgi:hypothetical protein